MTAAAQRAPAPLPMRTVNPGPVPTAIECQQVPGVAGRMVVMMRVLTPVGDMRFFLDPAMADALGRELAALGKGAKSNLVVVGAP